MTCHRVVSVAALRSHRLRARWPRSTSPPPCSSTLLLLTTGCASLLLLLLLPNNCARRRLLQRCSTLLNSFLFLTIGTCGLAGPLVTTNVAYTPHVIDQVGPSGVSSYQLLGVGRATWTAFTYSDHFDALHTTTAEGQVVTSHVSYHSPDPTSLPFS